MYEKPKYFEIKGAFTYVSIVFALPDVVLNVKKSEICAGRPLLYITTYAKKKKKLQEISPL